MVDRRRRCWNASRLGGARSWSAPAIQTARSCQAAMSACERAKGPHGAPAELSVRSESLCVIPNRSVLLLHWTHERCQVELACSYPPTCETQLQAQPTIQGPVVMTKAAIFQLPTGGMFRMMADAPPPGDQGDHYTQAASRPHHAKNRPLRMHQDSSQVRLCYMS
jgi:hypothetical protein